MKKRIISLCLVVCLLAVAIVGGTMAYFTDTDVVAKNTFTVGDVEIEQLELKRNENGATVPFTDIPAMVPATIKHADVKINNYTDVNGMRSAFITANNGDNNIYDKIIQVKNTGKVDAYVGTLIAIEDTNDVSKYFRYCTGGWTFKAMRMSNESDTVAVKIGNELYTVYCYVNNAVLEDGEYATPAMTQILMKDTATETNVADVNGAFNVYAASFGVQADGFKGADEAVKEAFGFEAMAASNAGGMRFKVMDDEALKLVKEMLGADEIGYYTGNAGTYTKVA